MKSHKLRRTKTAEDMRPLSMDDYTDTEFTGQKKKSLVERMGLIPYEEEKMLHL